MKETLVSTNGSDKGREDCLIDVQLLSVYPQSKAEYGLANEDFVEIRLYGGQNSVYCGPTLGQQFSTLQKTYVFAGKKSWAPNKKCFFGKVGSPVGRDLEKPGVV